jgi:thiosulfate dehydrogenase
VRRSLAVPLALSVAAALLALAACRRAPASDARDGGQAAASSDAAVEVPLRVPPDSEIPDGPLGASIRRGRALLAATADSLPTHVGARMRCTSCHLDEGRRANAIPLVGAYARYPTYSARSGRTSTIEDRIDDCFLRSMNGTALDARSDAMRDITAWLAFLSRGVPVGARVTGQGLAPIPPRAGDRTRGRAIYASTCARCHGADGEGTAVAPPLWGARSFNIGAGMARLRTAAAFVRRNMPFDRPGSLTDQQAFDVAAYLVSRPRPDFAGKEHDWPKGGAPPDAAY